MEKHIPHYNLESIKAGADDPEKLEMTTRATLDAASLGFGRAEIVQTVQSILRKHFYKSMTTNYNHKVWQDVYHVPSSAGMLYIKFSVGQIAEFCLVGFKEK